MAYRTRYFCAGIILCDPTEVLPPVDEPTAKREAVQRRYERRRVATGGVKRYRLTEVAHRDQFRCHICGHLVAMWLSGREPLGPTADHVLPVAHGGGDAPENIRLAHRVCNVRRGTRAVHR